MTEATLEGEPLRAVRVHVPPVGPWWADCDLIEAPDLEGAVTLALGELDLSGTVDPRYAGTHALERRVRVVAGAGGWGTVLEARAYHNDSGVRARTVADDAAAAAGETIATFALGEERTVADYVRQAGPASRVLEDIIDGTAWWVAYDGQTHVGSRGTVEIDPSSYDVLEYDPRARVATIAVDDPRVIVVGAVLDGEQLDEAQTVRELVLELTEDALRVRAWVGGDGSSLGRLGTLVRRIVQRATDGRLHGLYRYRVVRLSVDRLELQAVRPAAGLPDVLPISMWPGVAGSHSEPAAGAHVLVQFIEGDRRLPIVTGFAGKDGTGWTPTNQTFDVATLMKLGANASNFVALANLVKDRIDSLQEAHDTHKHTGVTAGTGSSAIPDTLVGPLGDVAATKVQAE